MIGAFGRIDESTMERRSGFPADFTWADRYRTLDFMPHVTRRGLDIVATDPETQTIAMRERMPGMPKRISDAELWIPIDLSKTVPVPPVVEVGLRQSGRLWRIRCARPVTFLPGVLARVGSRTLRLVIELDGFDPATISQIPRRLTDCDVSSAEGIALLIRRTSRRIEPPVTDSVRANDEHRQGLPPAATSILEAIRTQPLGSAHELGFNRRGGEELIGVLINSHLVRRLSSGHLIDEAQYQGLVDRLSGLAPRFASRDAATFWGTSHGFALAVLAEMVNDGRVIANPGKQYQVSG